MPRSVIDVERRERVALEVEERRVVGRRGDHRLGPGDQVVSHCLVRLGHPDRDHRLRAAERVDARRVAEDLGGGAGQPVDQPGLAVVVVHRERAVRLEVLAHRRHGLLGEEERLEADLRGAAHQGQRVGQREQDEVVVRPVRALQEGPAVVGVHVDPVVGVGPVDVGLGRRSRGSAGRCRPRRRGRAPSRSAIATSEPEPAPTTSTSPSALSGEPQVRRRVDPLALLELPLRGRHQLVRDAVGLDQQEPVVRGRRPPRLVTL